MGEIQAMKKRSDKPFYAYTVSAFSVVLVTTTAALLTFNGDATKAQVAYTAF